MRVLHNAVLAIALALASDASAAPPNAPKEVAAKPGQPVRVVVTGAQIGWKATFADDEAFFDELTPGTGTRRFMFHATKPGRYSVVFWTKDEVDGSVTTIIVGDAPAPGPGPGPKPPEPDPNPPVPEGFRVIFVYESSAPIPISTLQAMYGEKVRTYLDGKAKGWRRFDKDADGADEKDADIKALWQEARPKVTTVPCVIISVGGKADIIPMPNGEDDALAKLKKYGG